MAIPLSDLANLVTIAGAAVAAAAGYTKWRKPWQKRVGADGYTTADIRTAMRWYVPPDVVDHDPSVGDEPGDHAVSAPRVPLMARLDELLSPRSPTRFVLLLGDSGTGKTSALINYYVRCVRRLRPPRLAMARLGDEQVVEWIRRREDKGGTLLLLDALDELLRPGDDATAKLQELARETENFAKVVITCRTQYFERDEAVPAFADVWRRAPRAAGEGPREAIRRLYLAPLTDAQLERYLKKRFRFPHLKQRKRARRVIRSAPRLSVRPMLLSFLDDLSPDRSRDPLSVEIYEQGVNGWLRRESWKEKDVEELRRFSEALAVEMAVERRTAVLPEQAMKIARELGVSIDARTLSGRSLLNRDADGRWKFAHRSIMEFLVVKQFFAGEIERIDPWTDQMLQFAREALHAHAIRARAKAVASLSEERRLTLARSCRHALKAAGDPKPFMTTAAMLLVTGGSSNVTFYRVTARESWRTATFGEPEVLAKVGDGVGVRYRGDFLFGEVIERELINEVDHNHYLSVPVDVQGQTVYALALIFAMGTKIDRDALQALAIES